jgi:4-amino-4-deoxy-L-arabinose transferase-like glycosyltransferase
LTGSGRAAHLLLLALLGALVVGVLQSAGEPRLSWSDEIVYAVNGRRVTDGLGLTSAFYDHRVVLEQGIPTGDVHLPGHALILAVAFRALGASEAGARLPSQIGFVVAALGVFTVALRCCGVSAAWIAALMFLAWPAMGSYAVTAMGELTLVALASIWLLCWDRVYVRPTPVSAALLGLATGAMLLHRETSFALLPAALLPLLSVPAATRGRILGTFTLGAGPLVALAIIASAWKAHYPHFLQDLRASADGGRTLAHLFGMASRNIENFLGSFGDASQGVLGVTLATAVVLLVKRSEGAPRERRISLLAVYLLLAHAFVLLPIYPFRGWAAIRVLLVVAPALCVAAGCRLARVETRGRRVGVVALALACVLGVTTLAHRQLSEDRRLARGRERALVAEIEALTPPGRRVRTILAPAAFLYGWQHYPATVIWSTPASARELALVVEEGKADAVFVPGRLPLRERWDARLRELGFVPRTSPAGDDRLYLADGTE